jgi:hypothetical protein
MTAPSTHSVQWEDDGMVGHNCSEDKGATHYGTTTSTLSVNNNNGRGTCPRCGAKLQLKWDVCIEYASLNVEEQT